MRAKTWAASQGLCKDGRGRMSKEAHDAIKKAIAGGMVFDDYQIDKASGVVSKGVTVKKIEKEKTDDTPKDEKEFNPYADAFMRYDEASTTFVYDHNGSEHTVSGRTACMGCGYSLVGHTCSNMVGLTKHGQQTIRVKG